MTLSSGSLDIHGNLTPGSMSREIERALQDLVPLGANEDPLGRRKLALAIARGVIRHLSDEIGSFHTTVPNAGINTHQQSPTIDIDLGGWS